MEQRIFREVKEQGQLPTLLAAEAAQQLYDDPFSAHAVVANMHRSLGEHYKYLRQFDDQKGRYLHLRTIWMTTLAPLLHRAGLQTVRQALPILDRGEPLYDNIPAGSTIYDDDSPYKRGGRKPYKGARQDFMYVGAAWTVDAGQAALDGSLMLVPWYNNSHARYCFYEQQQRGFRRQINPTRHFFELLADSNEGPVEILEQFKEHFAPNASPETCRATFLTHINELADLESVRRAFLGERIISHWQNEPERCPYTNADDLATKGVWRIASLRNGPWSVPGFCPANIKLRSPKADDEALVKELFARCGQTYDGNGVSAAWLQLFFGAHLAAETLWAEEN